MQWYTLTATQVQHISITFINSCQSENIVIYAPIPSVCVRLRTQTMTSTGTETRQLNDARKIGIFIIHAVVSAALHAFCP
jgi:hypothetical protein